jgi:arylsulfatase
METIDDEVLEHGLDFIERKTGEGTPWFMWFNTTHMHLRTHPKPESVGQAGRWQSPYHDTMIDRTTTGSQPSSPRPASRTSSRS